MHNWTLVHGIAIRNKEDLDFFNDILSSSLLQNEENAFSFNAQTSLLTTKHLVYSAIGLHEKAFEYGDRCHQLIKNNSAFGSSDPALIPILTNMMANLYQLGEFLRILELSQQLRKINASNLEVRVKITLRALNYELIAYSALGEFDKGLVLVRDIFETFEKFGNRIPLNLKMALRFNIAELYLGKAEYRKALLALNEIFNDPKVDTRNDIYSAAHVLRLIAHLELENYDYLSHLVVSVYRFLRKKEQTGGVELAILKFIRNRLPGITSQKERLLAFQELKDELVNMSKSRYGNEILDYFDFISWFHSKIENRSFAEIVREKAKHKL